MKNIFIGCPPISNRFYYKTLLMTKFLILFMFIFSVQAMAKGFGQNTVTLRLNDVKVSKVIETIQDQGLYRFVYKDQILPKNERVSINVTNASIKEVLDQILKNTPLSFKFLSEYLIVITDDKPVVIDRVITIQGKVTNNKGEPLEGATVLLKNTNKQTLTKKDGSFSLDVDNLSGTLIISFVGTKSQEVAVNGHSVFNIMLEPAAAEMSDVIVVGYGTQKKADVTGAISSVTAATLKDQPVTNLQGALEGKTAGVQIIQNSGAPGASAQVRIRGLTSINNSDPLYVVDGIPLASNDINIIDPDNIASIDILKDASAQAIYGSRGANGVILIKTKRGTKDNPVITFSTFQGMSKVRKTLDMLDASDYVKLNSEAYQNAGVQNPFAGAPTDYAQSTDWQKALFRSAYMQNYNVAISGGSATSTYRVSGGYLDQDGTLIGSNYKRINLTNNLTFNVKPNVEIGESMAFNKSLSHNVETDYYGNIVNDAFAEDPTIPVQDAKGNYTATKYSDIVNPLAKIHYLYNNQPYNQWGLLGNAYIQYKPISGLALKSSYSLDLKFTDNKQFAPTYDVAPNFNNPNPHLYQQKDQTTNWTWDNTATYDFSLRDHHFTVLAGISAERFTYNYINGFNQGQPGNDSYLQYLDAGISAQQNGGSQQQWDLLSYIGRLNYNFRGTYLLTATIRRDGSSKFGVNDRYGNFPSASLGWVLTNESFFPKTSTLTFLKARGSWGIVGNQAPVGYYDYSANINTYYYALGNPATAQPSADPSGLANPNLKWEQVQQWNAGFDYHLFNDRLTGSFDYYQKTTKDMLLSLNILAISGFTQSPRENAGSMRNSGFEFSADYTQPVSRNFTLDAGLHFATIQNKVIDLLQNGEKIYSGGIKPGNTELTQVGHPVASFYGYVADGIFQTQQDVTAHAKQQTGTAPGDIRFKDLNKDGVVDQNDQTFLGSSIPKLTYGFNVGGTYNNFDFKLFFSGVWGNKLLAAFKYYTDGFFVSGYNMEKEALGRWTGAGTSNRLPRLIQSDPNNNSRVSSFYLQSGSYLRLQNMQIGYSLPRVLMHRIGVKSLRFYFSAQNLLTFTKYKGFDPEIGQQYSGSGGTLDIGVDNGTYPQSRTLSLGANLSF
jgi:TonB-linked SusC/RagA family outer membrane protein